MAGLLDEIRKSEALALAQQRLQGLLNIPAAVQQFMVSPASFMGLLGKNPLPRETGFAAGATGLPAQEMSVLDPNQAPYMQGYSQGEPVGYAGLALPLAAPAAVAGAKALGPKAGQALESYMVNQGMIQPLTAYHGTPHTIQGKFDINKVGTGEGAQAYGHGMYFAENPAVATQYKNILSKPEFTKTAEGVELRGQLPRMLDESYDELVAKNGIQQTNYGDVTDIVGQRLDRQMKDALKAKDMDWYNKVADMKLDLARFKENPPLNTGNLYKVDIPDADIPFMLDYDKPFEKQSKEVKEILKSSGLYKQYKQNLSDFSSPMQTRNKNARGENIQAFVEYLAGSPEKATEMLNELGIKGIRYLDEGSRTKGRGTSNYVVFDPADVKILEKNSEKVEGLLD